MTQPRHGRIVPQRSSRLRHGRMSPAPTAHTRQRMAWDASKATAHANQCISGSRLGANHAESAALNGPCAALNTRSIPRPSSPVSVSLRRCRCPDATTPKNGPHSSDRTGRRRSGHDLRPLPASALYVASAIPLPYLRGVRVGTPIGTISSCIVAVTTSRPERPAPKCEAVPY